MRDLPNDLQSIEPGHHQVDHQDIWLQVLHGFYRLQTVGGFSGKLEVRLGREQRAKAVAHHLVGTFTYDAISPFNPIKPDWHIGDDFIALYVREFGVAALVRNTALYGGLLAGVLAVGGYYVSRFFLPDVQPTKFGELEAAVD